MANDQTQQSSSLGYQVKGSGATTLVLLRGLARWSEHWLGFDDLLVEQGYRVLVIDNRGLGKSRHLKLESQDGIHLFAEDVAAVIAKEAPFGAHVIGTSLGGMIALALASGRPHLVKSLTIINSSFASSKKKRLTFKAAVALAFVALGLQSGYLKLASALLGSGASIDLKSQLASRWSTIDIISKVELSTLFTQIRAAKRFIGLTESAAIRCPVRIIKSAGDLFIDPANSDFIQKQIKGSSIAIHPNAGHEIAFEDPTWLSKEIGQFIRSCSAS
jgi:pimeloyl-ACP methyl ester carboxylesterase